MRKTVLNLIGCMLLSSSCGQYSNVLKTTDYEYKYEAAKEYYIKGQYSRSALLLGELIAVMKGTSRAEESLYMLAMSEYMNKNYDIAASYFQKYYQSYPKGVYVEHARYYSGRSLFMSVPDPRLDQTNTDIAIKELQNFLDLYPYTSLKEATHEMIYALQDNLIMKEYNSAKLYYDLGAYLRNCAYGGSNYQACIVTAQNALLDYPYASPERREEFSIMILRAKYHLAHQSVEEKRLERYRDAIDEYYGFINEFPESKYLKDAQRIYTIAEKIVNKKSVALEEEENVAKEINKVN